DAKWDPKNPFSLTIGNRKYTMRSVPEDLYRLISEVKDMITGKRYGSEFISARINPLVQTLDQLRSGLNYRGEKVTAGETLTQLLGKFIPITLRQIPGLRSLVETSRANPVSPLEQLAGSLGLKISRASPINDVYGLAHEWAQAKGLPADRGSYPVSKYQQLRYALEDNDMEKARDEYLKLVGDELKQGRLPDEAAGRVGKGFKLSVNHPFTGTKEHDEDFADSLKGDDKALYDLAVQRREDLLDRMKDLIDRIERGEK